MIYLYTDGSSTGRRDREWGWGYVVSRSEDGPHEAGYYGGGSSGTNNIAELTAAIKALEYVKHYRKWGLCKDKVRLISDSLYVLKTASGEYTPKKNLELCVKLRELFLELDAEGKWVKGHSGNKLNELADKYSKMGKAMYKPKPKVIATTPDWPGKEGNFK